MKLYANNLNGSHNLKKSMNNKAHSRGISDWYQNEESVDLTNFLTESENLELCSDKLFQNLFPSTSPFGTDLKQEKFDYSDADCEGWHSPFYDHSIPASQQCVDFNTSPITSLTERNRPPSPHHLQLNGLTTIMSSPRYYSLPPEDPQTNFIEMPLSANAPNLTITNVFAVKQEPNADVTSSNPLAMNSELHDSSNLKNSLMSSPSTSIYQENMSGSEFANFQKKNKLPAKGTREYLEKRRRNNVAVRRSRDKAKQKAQETQKKVDELSSENEKLHRRVAELTHELGTLKKLLQALPHPNS